MRDGPRVHFFAGGLLGGLAGPSPFGCGVTPYRSVRLSDVGPKGKESFFRPPVGDSGRMAILFLGRRRRWRFWANKVFRTNAGFGHPSLPRHAGQQLRFSGHGSIPRWLRKECATQRMSLADFSPRKSGGNIERGYLSGGAALCRMCRIRTRWKKSSAVDRNDAS